jgi:hypothetical protein
VTCTRPLVSSFIRKTLIQSCRLLPQYTHACVWGRMDRRSIHAASDKVSAGSSFSFHSPDARYLRKISESVVLPFLGSIGLAPPRRIRRGLQGPNCLAFCRSCARIPGRDSGKPLLPCAGPGVRVDRLVKESAWLHQ